jgi:hypothetical protein
MSNSLAQQPLTVFDQAELLYEWESEFFPHRDSRIITLKQCRELVKDVWVALNLVGEPPVIEDGRGSICARNFTSEIHLPKWARNNIIVLHELAHTLTEFIDPQDNASHGGIFVHVMLTLLTRFSDYKYSEMAESAARAGVKVTKVKLNTRLKAYMNKP